jgi:hypothetical protein
MHRAVLAWLFAGSSLAWANGQTSHVWISQDALSYVPEGELRDLLVRDDLRVMLLNGTMFPDGGYAVGDPYGETAHWEPFQTAYADWIRATYEPPWTDEAAQHIAFLMGMASHGMADQVYDSLYMERAKDYDASSDWANASMDEATDVAFAAGGGAQEVPEMWVPTVELAALFAEASQPVDPELLEDAQLLLGVAIYFVGSASQQPDTVADYEEAFPWATTHQYDVGVPGTPRFEAEVIARYWGVIWERLHGRSGLEPSILATVPADGGYGLAIEADSPESRVSIVFARGLAADALSFASFVVTDADGADVPVEIDLFYGEASHVVHVSPVGGWADHADYTLTVRPGVTTFDDVALGGGTLAFSTRPVAPEPQLSTIAQVGGCATSPTGLGWAWVGVLLVARRRGGDGGAQRRRGRSSPLRRSRGLTRRELSPSAAPFRAQRQTEPDRA